MTPIQPTEEVRELSVLRSEPNLLKLPFHLLAKQGRTRIHLERRSPEGKMRFLWKVSPNTAYGPPRELAHTVDRLVVDKRLYERWVPGGEPAAILPLGALRELCRMAGMSESGKSGRLIKQALKQNASAFIEAFFQYRTADGVDRRFAVNFTKYSVYFYGETHEGVGEGRELEDLVYLVLHKPYQDLIATSAPRPLDFNYYRTLRTPSSQRFYELVGFDLYAAIKHRLPYAKVAYSTYCQLAPQERNFALWKVKRQMRPIHDPHVQQGYILEPQYRSTKDEDGALDWWILYQPGGRARDEYRRLRRGSLMPRVEEVERTTVLEDKAQEPASKGEREEARNPGNPTPRAYEGLPDEKRALVQALMAFNVTEAVAMGLIEKYPSEATETHHGINKQIIWLPHRPAKDPAAVLVAAIRENWQPPAAFEQAERDRVEAERYQREQEEQERALAEQRTRELKAIQEGEAAFDALPQEEQGRLLAEAREKLFRNHPKTRFMEEVHLQESLRAMVVGQVMIRREQGSTGIAETVPEGDKSDDPARS